MRVRNLHRRVRPFRYGGFWLLGGAVVLSEALTTGQWRVALGFCGLWPWLADRLRVWNPPGGSAAEPTLLVAECALAGGVLGWAGLPPLALYAFSVCLLSGLMALSGWPLLLPAAAALLAGGGLGLHWAPRAEALTWLPADWLALTLIAVFSLALARSSCHQARRLDADRVVLARRTTELERLTGRMRRYLPPSLRERLVRSSETRSWERRWLTVVFVDLVGFAELAERQEAEPLAQLLDDYLTLLVDAAEGHGGEVSKMLGDGVLVVFGADADSSDESGRTRAVVQALTFGAATPLQLAALAARWQARGEPVSLRMRAGVASGYCTLGDRGGADRVDFTLVGSAVNLASRLQAAAPEDGVLLDAASAVLATTHFPLAGPRAMTIKGIGPVSVYQLLDAADPQQRGGARVDRQ